MPKKQLLSGLGPDKLEYVVSEAKDRFSLLICCGRGKGRVLRLKRPEGVLTHELAFRRIAESLNIGALDSENTSDPSRGAAAEKMTLSEGHTFTAIGAGEGGALKAAADDYYEHQDSSISERRMTIRNAEELVNFGRSQFGTTKRDFSRKRAMGCIDVTFI